MSSSEIPIIFFDICIDGALLGRMKVNLLADEHPDMCELFRKFCTGEFKEKGTPIGYKHSIFHKLEKGRFIEGGDFAHTESLSCSYPGRSAGSMSEQRHAAVGLLSVSRPNESHVSHPRFLITLGQCHSLDDTHIVIGKVTDAQGLDILSQMEEVPVDNTGKPRIPVTITQCGQM